jgi:MSHA biogenesis protein MshN
MSIINRMLQDLDRREAMGEPAAQLAEQVRPVLRPERADREWFWRILAVLLLAGVVWVGWVAWQLQPGPQLATEEALKAAARLKPPAPAVATATPRLSSDRVPASEPTPAPPAPEAPKPASARGDTAKPVAEAPPKPSAAPEASKVATPPPAQARKVRPAESFKLSKATDPIAREKPLPGGQTVSQKAPAVVPPAPKAKAAAGAPPSGTAKPSPSEPPARIGVDVPPARILPAPPRAAGRVQKRDRVIGPEERAESEFRRGVALLNQGRVSEAEELFDAALSASHKHEAARQALIALRLEQRRYEDARRLLQEGLAVNPANAQFAAVLARLHLERRDYAAALETLDGIHSAQPANPDVALLRATALQRLGRHAQAAEAFQSALRGSPQSGQAWLGLALSLDALGKAAEAAQAFRRAAGSASLGEDARAYAEQRARQLQ